MLIQTETQFQEFMDWFSNQSIVGFDTETTGLRAFHGDRVVGLSFAGLDGASYYIPFRHGDGDNLPLSLLSVLIDKMNEQHCIFATWNAKFDLLMLYADNFKIPDRADKLEDVMCGAHLMNENEPNYKLKDTADRYKIGVGSKDEEELKDVVMGRFRCENGHKHTDPKCTCKRITPKTWKGQMWRLRPEEVSAYAETDAVLTLGLREFYVPHLTSWNLLNLYVAQNNYLLTLTRMEVKGLPLDVAKIREYHAECDIEREKVLQHFRTITKREDFNPGSVPQLRAAFGWPNTKEDTLLEYAEAGDENAQKVLDYRGWDKVKTTYYDVWLELMDEHGILRTNMNIIGTYTGRLSSMKPNLQAIPRYSSVYKVKDCVIAGPGETLLEIDLAGAELRVACHYANERVMGEILARGGDLHTETADLLGIDRTKAKRINLSAIYGIGAKTFAEKYGYDVLEAKAFLAKWHKLYRGFKSLYFGMQTIAEEKGFIKLDSGRYRRYRFNGVTVGEYQKASSNFVQGTVGEIMRVAMDRIDVQMALRGRNAHILLTVHDSLLLLVPENEVDYWLGVATKALTDFKFDPPLDVEAKVGRVWGQAEHVDTPAWAKWRPSKYLPNNPRPQDDHSHELWWCTNTHAETA